MNVRSKLIAKPPLFAAFASKSETPGPVRGHNTAVKEKVRLVFISWCFPLS